MIQGEGLDISSIKLYAFPPRSTVANIFLPSTRSSHSMLKILRKGANTFIVKLLLFFIALSFMVWGVGDYVNSQNQQPVAEADHWAIGPREFAMAYDNEFQRMRQRFGGSLDKKTAEVLGLKQKTLNAMINRNLILAKSHEMRLTVSDTALRDQIATNPVFHNERKFDPERYALVLRNNQMSPRDYEQKLKTDLIAAQLQQALTAPLNVPDLFIDNLYALENEKRSVELLTLPLEPILATITATDAELKAHLERNHERYVSPTQVQVHYILLGSDSLRETVVIPDAEIDDYFDEHKEEYRQEEKRNARHILFKIGDGVTEEQAREKAVAAKGRIDKGEAFEAVAREVSEDVSASQGGELGLVARGVMVPAFEEAVFSLEKGVVSEPVLTPFGIHLIRVDEVHAARIRPEPEVKVEIKALLTEKKAMDLVYERAAVMEDQVFASGDLKSIASDLNLRYKELDFFSREDLAKLDGLEQEKKFLDAAFATTKGELSPMVELSEGKFMVLRVNDRKEPQPRPLEEVREQVLRDYKQEQGAKLARERMERILKELTEGSPWEQAVTAHPGLKAESIDPFTRSGEHPKVGTAIRAAAFKLTMEAPMHREIIDNSGVLTLLRLKGIETADRTKFKEQERKKMVGLVEEGLGLEQLTAYLDGLWTLADIRINHKILDQF
ncbi:MAG: SurA N-terminal domain-containing protein [Magnetococcales bacterium]|nr:SurA N-terminal domain-containing protein [Magnetococcales bacterium]